MTDKSGRYVLSIDVLNGHDQVIYGRDANSRIADATLAIQPFTNNNGDVVWRVVTADAAATARATNSDA